jgi:hypothetical protein
MDDRLPNDLVPLPTAPYDERPSSLPLDVDECRTAIWLNRGNITEAAKQLKTQAARLRKFVASSPYLQREVEEAREQLLDIAEDVAYEALIDSSDTGRRDGMARFVLGNLGKRRGYGTGSSTVNINSAKGPISISWGDGTSLAPDSKTIDHE